MNIYRSLPRRYRALVVLASLLLACTVLLYGVLLNGALLAGVDTLFGTDYASSQPGTFESNLFLPALAVAVLMTYVLLPANLLLTIWIVSTRGKDTQLLQNAAWVWLALLIVGTLDTFSPLFGQGAR